ncbi:hypothetical protein F511_28649 [Dorcoceras hygrometricum]|uniref:Uncharacterized protein n=1 Tax=Dorcoceras hygrometricum TaxID=472368 RepID=A0A2Z7AKA5_9LAMI|nr:hypothetical protein F511_28649 [Dorcoceras hygrometricum]
MYRRRRSAAIFVQAVGSQHYRSAVGLVFMESAVELAMETSRVDSVVPGSYSDQQEDSADEKRGARYGMSCDDISLDSQESAGSLHSRRKRKRRRRGDPVASYSAISRCYLKIVIAKRCRLHKLIRQRFALALKIRQEDFALLFQQTKLQCPVATQRHPVARRFRRN